MSRPFEDNPEQIEKNRIERLKQQFENHREDIALKAMVAILGRDEPVPLSSIFNSAHTPAQELATECYAIADAMIAQKNKLPNTRPDNE